MNSLKNLEESMGCNTIRDDHGGGVIYQRVHMDKAEFDEMLRKVEEEYSGLQAENAKLRELVSELWEGYMDPPCEECQLQDTPICADCPICAREAAVIDRMRELGVEVDG